MAGRGRNKKVVLEQVAVSDYAAEGKSLARVDGKVIFIQGGAVPGDIVDVRLSKNKKDWAEGKAVHFHRYAEDRVAPFCAHFGICGGCKWQMLPYEQQLRYKHQQVEAALHHIGKLDLPPLDPIIGAEQTTFYRNKLEFTFSNRAYLSEEEMQTEGWSYRDALGFHLPGLFDKILDIDTCYLQADPSNLIRNTVRDFALLEGYDFYDHRAHSGWLRNLVVRTSTTGEVMVNLCIHHEDETQRRALLDHLLERVPAITSLFYTLNSKGNDSIADLEPVLYHGNDHITEKLERFLFKIGPKSFFQTNTRQAEKLYGVVRNFAGLGGTETVYDLYCGAGSIGIFLSQEAGKIIGVEQVAEAVLHALENARINGIGHASFYQGDVTDVCTDEFFAAHGRPDIVITDPPRAGMHDKLVAKLLEMEAPRIVYVSCNPATQARDLMKLSEKYSVKKIQPVDLFPHTHHIENVVLLEKEVGSGVGGEDSGTEKGPLAGT
ncbi:MAG TPA: 23S rRNA (uracil(1939)-C(5))-methyltransferase RlmD [Chitinophagaceae bacterium]|nr:23S rRNA (uracil(1939)-C(5))-methyltransferase RlmD [Chitinophagaceae bacterium]